MKVIVVLGLLGLALYAQQQTKNETGCGVVNVRAWQDYEAYEYQKSIVNLLRPADRALKTVSVFETGNTPKYFLRMKAPRVFELNRVSSTEALPVIIERLRNAGELPVSPREAIKLIDFKWESKTISPADFEQMYSGFSDALSRYTSNVEKPLLSGDRITVDAPEFSIGYTTAGFGTFEITASASRDQSGNLNDPTAEWATGFMETARRRFDAGAESRAK